MITLSQTSASTAASWGSSAMAWRSAARTWSRSGSPLATSRGRRQAATSRTRRCRVCRLMAGRPRYRCSSGMVQARGWARSRRMRAPSRRLPSRGRPGRGRSARLWAPWVLYRWTQRRTVRGSQPSSSAMVAADQPCWDSRIMTRRQPIRCGPCSNPSRSHGSPAGQERLAYTLGGRILAQPREVVVVASSNGPRGYFLSGPPLISGLRTEPLASRLGSRRRGLRTPADGGGACPAQELAYLLVGDLRELVVGEPDGAEPGRGAGADQLVGLLPQLLAGQ